MTDILPEDGAALLLQYAARYIEDHGYLDGRSGEECLVRALMAATELLLRINGMYLKGSVSALELVLVAALERLFEVVNQDQIDSLSGARLAEDLHRAARGAESIQ